MPGSSAQVHEDEHHQRRLDGGDGHRDREVEGTEGVGGCGDREDGQAHEGGPGSDEEPEREDVVVAVVVVTVVVIRGGCSSHWSRLACGRRSVRGSAARAQLIR